MALTCFGVLLGLTAANFVSLSHGASANLDVVRFGSAVVSRCDTSWPVSGHGFGRWSTCSADITWQDGSREVRVLRDNFFTPEEIGLTVPVGQTQSGVLLRQEEPQHSYYVLAGMGMGLIALISLVGGLTLAIGAARQRRPSYRASAPAEARTPAARRP